MIEVYDIKDVEMEKLDIADQIGRKLRTLLTIFREYVDCYNAIQVLKIHGILDEEEAAVCEHNLLADVIDLFKSELER